MTTPLGRLRVAGEGDVFAARRQIRAVAAGLGFDTTDQVRIAIAVSEFARVLVARSVPVSFVVDFDGPAGGLVIRVESERPGRTAGDWGGEWAGDVADGARRLMDDVAVRADDPAAWVRLVKRLPVEAPPATELARLRSELEGGPDATPLEDLTAQNEELLRTLEQLRLQQDELLRLNAELEETNRGVMAMYGQLSSELEETNRGVVALYAELDERGAQLRAANTAKSRFLANVSHELRSPLNSIVGLTALLRDPESDPLTAEQGNQLRLVQASARQLLGMVDELLDLAKAESGRLHPVSADVDVEVLLNDLRAGLRPITRAGVDLALDVEPDLPTLRTDATLLAQVLRNLMSNAVKFTEAGRVTVTVRAAAAGVRFEVSDTGIGIAAEHAELVFEEFFQVPGRLQVGARGTGLGLPYAAQVVAALGGRLELTSTVGGGSTFTFTLPAERSMPPGATAEQLVSTVLVVDDDPAFRQIILTLLSGTAERVLEAHSAESALHQMRHVRPDLVLLDLRMPEAGGEVVLERMAEDDELAAIPVVIVTSLDSEDIPSEVRAGREVLHKADTDAERLAATIRTAVAR